MGVNTHTAHRVLTYSLVISVAVSHAFLFIVSASFEWLLAVSTHEMLQRENDTRFINGHGTSLAKG